MGKVSDGVRGELAGESVGGQTEGGDAVGCGVAGDAFPKTGGWGGAVPAEGGAPDGVAEEEEGGSVVRGAGRKERKQDGEKEDEVRDHILFSAGFGLRLTAAFEREREREFALV